MKKFKIMLIAAGLMVSLSFFSCFAAQNEKKIDMTEEYEKNNTILQNMTVMFNVGQQGNVANNAPLIMMIDDEGQNMAEFDFSTSNDENNFNLGDGNLYD